MRLLLYYHGFLFSFTTSLISRRAQLLSRSDTTLHYALASLDEIRIGRPININVRASRGHGCFESTDDLAQDASRRGQRQPDSLYLAWQDLGGTGIHRHEAGLGGRLFVILALISSPVQPTGLRLTLSPFQLLSPASDVSNTRSILLRLLLDYDRT